MKSKLFFVFSLIHSSPVWACTVCFGDPRSSQTKSVIAGILFLLALIGSVLTGIGITIFRFYKRSQILAASENSLPS